MSQLLRSARVRLPCMIVLLVVLTLILAMAIPSARDARAAGADGVWAGWGAGQRREVPYLHAGVQLER